MRFWKTFLLFIVFGLIIFLAIMASKILIAGEEGGIYFLSFRPGYFWRVDKEKLTGYKQELKNFLGANLRVLVILYPNLKKTQMATGWGDNDPTYYGEWKKWNGWNILAVYLDKGERQKLPAETRNRLLGLFVVGEINRFLGAGESGLMVEEPFLRL